MEDLAQPTKEVLDEVLAAHAGRPGALLPILHDLQDRLGHIPADAVPRLATALNLSRAEVHGVITYYPHFRQHPPARHVVQVCRAEACQAVGANRLAEDISAMLGCAMHGTTADNAVALEPVYCLGQCAVGPAVMVDDKLHARMTPEWFKRIALGLRGAE
jgi:formate dehydrogenase subunit gamma